MDMNLQKDQYRLTAHVEELWNEWEIQLLVLVSFGLQVFLLLFSGIRKRTTSSVLSGFLWLAYVLADYLAVFVLGHLTLHISSPRHGLVLFWAPFMLLHLGGQETITAFSMEDNMLWKRHLLSLVTQVGLAAYVIGKQWQGDKQLLAPMVLMFVSGTLKYAGRTLSLMLVAKEITPGGRASMLSKDWSARAEDYTGKGWMLKEKQTYPNLLWEAHAGLALCLAFLMDKTPLKTRPEIFPLEGLISKEHRVHISYKLAELQLRIIYDFGYTKVGTRIESRENPLNGWFLRLVTLGCTFTALVLFSLSHQHNLLRYTSADVIASYILLCGAIILEMISIFIAISSVGKFFIAVQFHPSLSGVSFRITSLVHPESRPQWSQKLAQYNLIGGCIRDKQPAGCGEFRCIKRMVGIKHDTTHIDISHELKKLVLDKLLKAASRTHEGLWDISKFTGQWAKLELQGKHQERTSTLLWLLTKSIERPGFMSSVLTWHLVTDVCFFHDGHELAGCNHSVERTSSRELSNYVMYLCAKHGIMSGNDGHLLLSKAQKFINDSLASYKGSLDESASIKHITGKMRHVAAEGGQPGVLVAVEPVITLALQLVDELHMIKEESDRWEIILNVWIEMLCYMSFHCGSDFHIKHLSTGGEFITHVKVVIYNLDFPYSTYVPENDEEPSHPGEIKIEID